MTETIIFINGLCRCCHAHGNYKSLGVPYAVENKNEIYSVMIKETLDIIIPPIAGEDSASTYTICEFCIISLRDAAKFKHQVLTCEEKLTSMVHKNLKLEVNNCKDDLNNAVLNYDEDNGNKYYDENNIDLQYHMDQTPKLPQRSNIRSRKTKAKHKLRSYIEQKQSTILSKTESIMDYKGAGICWRTEASNNIDSEKHLKKESTCNICEREFTPKGLTIHMKKIHSIDKKYSCYICHNNFAKNNELTKHIEKTHKDGNSYTCNVCNHNSESAKLLKKHLNEHYTNEFVKCDECNKEFKRKSQAEHLKTHTQRFTCNYCSKSFISKQNLMYHILTHTGEKPYICHVCAKTFNRADHLKNHIFIVHSGEKPFECKYCPKRFNIKWSKIMHERQHTGKKPFACEICKKKFASKNHLKTHAASHTELKPHSCHTCGRQFSFLYTLKQHMTMHTGQKDFVCDICDKPFRQKATLKSHMRTHTGEKAYTCDVCNDKFASKATLKSHIRRHTGEKYTCKICNKQISDIYQHMRRHSRGMN